MQAPGGGISVLLQDEGAASPVSLDVSEALAVVLGRAASVGSSRDRSPLSFSSLIVGLFAAPDATGAWLRERYPQVQPGVDQLLASRGIRWPTLVSLADAGMDADLSKRLSATLERTISAARALDEAARLARSQQVLPAPAHLLEAMLTLPGYHDADFERLGIERVAWVRDFRKAQSTPESKSAATATGEWTSQLAAEGVEPHVLGALRVAAQLAGADSITCAHVLTAAVQLAPVVKSAAFLRLAELLASTGAARPSPLDLGPNELQARLSPALRDALAWAQQPAAPGDKPQPLWGRDLVTAALLGPDDEVGPTVAAAGCDLALVRDQWYAFVAADTSRRSRAQWSAWWRRAGVALPGPRRAGYALETDQGDDKLGIEAEASAFARLILDKDVHPPLSIGLLGDWGSGKSFFIEQIKKYVAALREEGRPELYRHVVEIEFNAWHASDANLAGGHR